MLIEGSSKLFGQEWILAWLAIFAFPVWRQPASARQNSVISTKEESVRA